jgi:hypothetical protein
MNNRNGGLAVGSPDRYYPGIYFQPQYPAKEEEDNNNKKKHKGERMGMVTGGGQHLVA